MLSRPPLLSEGWVPCSLSKLRICADFPFLGVGAGRQGPLWMTERMQN